RVEGRPRSARKLGGYEVEQPVERERDLDAQNILDLRLGAAPQRNGCAERGPSLLGDANRSDPTVSRVRRLSDKSSQDQRLNVAVERRGVHSHPLGKHADRQALLATNMRPQKLREKPDLVGCDARRLEHVVINSGQIPRCATSAQATAGCYLLGVDRLSHGDSCLGLAPLYAYASIVSSPPP